MTSVTDICNRALSEIGTRSRISSLTENSVEAQACALWYDELRQELLRTAPWGFARQQLVLSQLGDLIPDQTSPYPFGYKYSYPSDCIKFRYLIPPPCCPANNSVAPPTGEPLIGPTFPGPSRAFRYVVYNDKDRTTGLSRKTLLSNVYAAIGCYTGDITDPDLFDPSFRLALTAYLSYKLVIPLSGNVGMKKDFAGSCQAQIIAARVNDANESIPTSDIKVDWMETRGVGSVWGAGSGLGTWGSFGSWNCSWDNISWGM